MVLDLRDAEGIIGRSIRSAKDEDMGRVVDVIVSTDGDVRAVVIDFGGFLGVGSRKVAVDWAALKFSINAAGAITTALTRNQVRVSPEYKVGEPIVVLQASPEAVNAALAGTPAAPAAPPPAAAPAPAAALAPAVAPAPAAAPPPPAAPTPAAAPPPASADQPPAAGAKPAQ